MKGLRRRWVTGSSVRVCSVVTAKWRGRRWELSRRFLTAVFLTGLAAFATGQELKTQILGVWTPDPAANLMKTWRVPYWIDFTQRGGIAYESFKGRFEQFTYTWAAPNRIRVTTPEARAGFRAGDYEVALKNGQLILSYLHQRTNPKTKAAEVVPIAAPFIRSTRTASPRGIGAKELVGRWELRLDHNTVAGQPVQKLSFLDDGTVVDLATRSRGIYRLVGDTIKLSFLTTNGTWEPWPFDRSRGDAVLSRNKRSFKWQKGGFTFDKVSFSLGPIREA
jgi:hypothetical protein